jgi:hypothetical protein
MAKWTRETPWRQGQLLTDEAVKSLNLVHPEFQKNTLVVVATHDCDLVQSPDKEPNVELIVGCKIAHLDGNSTHAKSSRTLHVKFDSAEPLSASFVITAKCSIPKDALLDFMPVADVKLSPQNLTTFQQWLACRYRRSAFPDEFERRLVHETKLAEKISKAIKPHGEWITAIFFDVDEGRDIVHKGSDDLYVLDIILLHSTEPDAKTAESVAIKAKEAIEKAFNEKLYDHHAGKWKWIELRYIDVISEEGLTYKQSKLLKKWRLDYISLEAEPQQAILKEH